MAIIKKSINHKCWRGCGEKETLLHCWWEPKWLQSLWRTVWRFCKNWEQNYHLTNPTTGHIPWEDDNSKFLGRNSWVGNICGRRDRLPTHSWASLVAQQRIRLQCGRPGFNPWVGRYPGEGKGYPLQYSGLENSMDCIVPGVAKSQTWLSDFYLPQSSLQHCLQ